MPGPFMSPSGGLGFTPDFGALGDFFKKAQWGVQHGIHDEPALQPWFNYVQPRVNRRLGVDQGLSSLPAALGSTVAGGLQEKVGAPPVAQPVSQVESQPSVGIQKTYPSPRIQTAVYRTDPG